MPVVPIDNTRVPSQALPGARLTTRFSPGALGGDAAQGADAVAGVSARIAAEEQHKASQIALADARNKRFAGVTAIAEDVLNRKGANAIKRNSDGQLAAQADAQTAYQKHIDEISKGLNTQEEREAFRVDSDAQWNELNQRIGSHVINETNAFDDEVTETEIANQREQAVARAAAGDPSAVDALAAQKDTIDQYAKRTGKPEGWAESRLAKETSATHAAVIDRLLKGKNDLLAAAYYKAHKGDLNTADAGDAEAKVRTGSVRGESRRISDQILLEYEDPREQLKAARAIEDTDVRDATIERLQDHHRLERQAVEEARRQTFDRVTEVLDRSGGDMDWVEESDLHDLGPERLKAARDYAAYLAGGVEPVTDRAKYDALIDQALNRPADFLKVNLKDARPYLSDERFKEMQALQAQMNGAKGGQSKLLSGTRTKKDIVDGIISNRKWKKDSPEALLFEDAVDNAVVDWQVTNGKEASPQDVKKIANDLFAQTVFTKAGSWIGRYTEKPVYQLTADEAAPGNVFVQDQKIPKIDADEIRNQIVRAGKEPTDPLVRKVYAQSLIHHNNQDAFLAAFDEIMDMEE